MAHISHQISASSDGMRITKATASQPNFNPLEWAYIELIDKFASIATIIAVCIAGYQMI